MRTRLLFLAALLSFSIVAQAQAHSSASIANLGARYDITKWLQLFGQINNLFNRQYFTAAQLGPTGFTNTGAFIARPFAAVDGEFPVVHATFYSPGAPRGAWGGVRIKF
jgi:outer membrane receptor protein involved in Fe transport